MLIFSVTTDRDPCGPGVSVTANSVDITHGPGIESPGGLVLRLGVQDTGKASHVPEANQRVGPEVATPVVSARLRVLPILTLLGTSRQSALARHSTM